MPDPELVTAYQRILRLGAGHTYGLGDRPLPTEFRDAADARLDAYALKMANQLERVTFQSAAIRKAVQEKVREWMAAGDDLTLSDLSLELEPLLGGVRALLIARTETGLAFNAAQAYGYAAVGFTHVTWIASPFACPICDALDGQVFAIEDYVAEAIAHPNCGCSAEPEGGDEEEAGQGDAEDQWMPEAA